MIELPKDPEHRRAVLEFLDDCGFAPTPANIHFAIDQIAAFDRCEKHWLKPKEQDHA